MNTTRLDGIAALGRLLLAAIFIMGGASKLTTSAELASAIAAKGLPLPEVGAWVAIAIELLGGLAVLVGFQTRLAGLALAAWCIVTAAIYHYVPGDRNMMIHFWKNVSMAGGFLQLAAWGGGAWSIDAMFARRARQLQPAE